MDISSVTGIKKARINYLCRGGEGKFLLYYIAENSSVDVNSVCDSLCFIDFTKYLWGVTGEAIVIFTPEKIIGFPIVLREPFNTLRFRRDNLFLAAVKASSFVG